MNKKELVLDFFAGKIQDYVPVTACYHFGQQHLNGDIHAQLEIAFYEKFAPDILKVMNDYSFFLPIEIDPVNNLKSIYNLKKINYLSNILNKL